MFIDYIWARSRNIFGSKHLSICIYTHVCMCAHVLLFCFGTSANMIYPFCLERYLGLVQILKGGGYGGGGCVGSAWLYYYHSY